MRILDSFFVVAATLVATQTARAEDTAKPAPQLEAIRAFIGSWSGKGSMMSEGKTYSITATYDCAESAGAAGVKCRAVINGIPGFTYTFDDLWGYSPQDGLVHWYVVTNAGEVHDHRGHLDSTGGLVEVQIATQGKLFSEIINIKRKNKSSFAWSWASTHGGTLREKGELSMQLKTK